MLKVASAAPPFFFTELACLASAVPRGNVQCGTAKLENFVSCAARKTARVSAPGCGKFGDFPRGKWLLHAENLIVGTKHQYA